ncbi:MAG: TonB-dependent receptor [Pseudomonadota bacterium]
MCDNPKSGGGLKTKLLAGSFLTVLMGAVPFTAAQAQEIERVSEAADDDEAVQDTIVVTGSRLKNPNITASSPVVTVDVADFRARGTIDVVDLINTLPSAIAGQTSEVSNGANGTSSLNLRGLGATRNLVLIDGKRLGPGRADIAVADLNQIPAALIERSEIVTGGASAVYGSDAIAGVANFFLRRDFEGFEFSSLVGFNQDANSNGFAQDINLDNTPPGPNPTGGTTDGFTWQITGIYGTNFDNDKGNITAYASYFDQNAILQGTRDISACALGDVGPADAGSDPVIGTDVFCFGSNFGPFPTTFTLPAVNDPATGLPFPADMQPGLVGTVSLDEAGNVPLAADGSVALGATNAFNFNPLNFFQRPSQRFNAGFLSRYELHKMAEVYTDFAFTQNVSDAQIAPTATFGEVAELNCDNPFFTPDILQIICTDRGFSGTDLATVQLNRRNVEGGGRNTSFDITNFRVVSGVRGDLSDYVDGWSYDAFVQFADTATSDINEEDFDIELLNEALLVTTDADGNPVCTSGRAGCVPLNLLGTTPVDPVAIAAISTPTLSIGEAQQVVTGLTFQGPVPVTSPFAANAPSLLTGFEWRQDTLSQSPDSILLAGGSTGLGGPEDPVSAQSRVWELFTEVAIPLVEDVPFIKEFSFTGQYRYSDFSYTNKLPGGDQAPGIETNTFSLGTSWIPVDDVRFRFQFQRAARAPNIFELFAPASLQLFNDSDPCAGPAPAGSLAGCVASGLPEALFGLVPADAGQLQELVGGNVGLEEEEADTFTAGAVLQPRFVPGLTVSVDYFNIDVEGFITTIPSQTILSECIDNLDATFCQFINRDALGTIQIDGFVEANLQNIGARSTEGIDFSANYTFDLESIGLGNYGSINLTYAATYLTEFEQIDVPGQAPTDCLGFFAGPCDDIVGQPTFEYRHTSSVGWQTPWDVDFRLAWRYFSDTERLGPRSGADGSIGDVFETESFVDVFVNYNLNENINLNFGVNNLFDADPSFTDFRDTANGNTFPGVFDAAGRYIFFGTRLTF